MAYTYCVLCICAVLCLSNGDDVSVKTTIGTIIGREIKVTVKGAKYTVKTFFGIPYAQPPVGLRRFEKPEIRASFDSAYIAKHFRPACPQPVLPTMPAMEETSEDCLYLNIYVPGQTPDRQTHGHPVMVFIHGGAFVIGAGDTYPGENLAAFGNVIVVTINYRLGVFGFMNTGDGKIRGNAGLFDQHLALKWINQHIGSFGGDKNRVTIFGESAGGSSVVFQGLYPANKGLVHRIISQSGIITAHALMMPNPRQSCLTLATEMGCDTTNMEKIVECLKAAERDKLLNTVIELTKDPEKMAVASFLPSIDGEIIRVNPSRLSEVDLVETEARQQVDFFRSLDFMSGFTDKDGGVFLYSPVNPIADIESFTLQREDFVTKAAPVGIYLTAGNVPDPVKSILISEYTNWTDPNSPLNNRDEYVRLLGDGYFVSGSIAMSRLHTDSNTGNTYTFLFSAIPETHALKTPTWLTGANHGDEIGYVFLFPEAFRHYVKKIHGTKHVIKDWEYELSYQIATYWTNFAKSGNPNKPVDVSLEWPSYDMEDQRYINLNKESSTGKYFCAREANLWLNTIPEMKKALSRDHDPSSPFVKKTDTDTCSADGVCDGE